MKSHAVNRVEQLLREIENSDHLQVNTVVLNSVMSAWVKSKKAAAVDRTTELIETMEVSEGIQPDQVSYNTHLHSLSLHANPWRPELVERAYAVLDRMDTADRSGVRPNTFTYNLVMEVVCKTNASDAAARAVALLNRLKKCKGAEPDTFTFNKALSAFSTSDDENAAEKAEELLRNMDDSHKSGMLRKARPDAASFATVINAYSQSDRKDSAVRAQALFDEMKARSTNGEEHLRPTRVCYNSMIDCWGKSGEGTYGARQAESLLQEMIETSTTPDLTTFNAVLNAWAKSGTRCCGNQAEKYLNRMWNQYNAGNKRLKPNRISYNTVRHVLHRQLLELKLIILSSTAIRSLTRFPKANVLAKPSALYGSSAKWIYCTKQGTVKPVPTISVTRRYSTRVPFRAQPIPGHAARRSPWPSLR